MNDIITDFIGKQISKRLEYNRPIEQQKVSIFRNKHLRECKKMICVECSKILKENN